MRPQLGLLLLFSFTLCLGTQAAPMRSQSGHESARFPFQNYDLPLETRVSDLVSRLTLREKIAQTWSEAAGIERFGVKPYNWRSNCLHGWTASGGSWAATTKWTVFPGPIALAAAWNTELMRLVGIVTSDEGRAIHELGLKEADGNSTEGKGLNCFAPNVNLFRDPRWGRGQETYGEDPFLVAEMGVAYTRGLQEGTDPNYLKIAACAKHYAVHSGPESLRLKFNVNISAHDLWDTYLPAFQAQVERAGVATFMPAYNAVDGFPDAANPNEVLAYYSTNTSFLLIQVLRKMWGFTGATISDNGGVEAVYQDHHFVDSPMKAAAACMNAQCNMDLKGRYYIDYLEAAIQAGLVQEDAITEAVKSLMRIRFRLGDFDPAWRVPYKWIPLEVLNSEQHQQLNIQSAKEGLVLLMNQHSTLPLSVGKLKSIAVIGPNANATDTLLGNYQGIPAKIVTVLEGIQTKVVSSQAIPRIAVRYAAGCSDVKCESADMVSTAVGTAKGADAVVFVMGIDQTIEKESIDRVTGFRCDATKEVSPVLGLPGCQSYLISQTMKAIPSNTPVVLVLINGGPLSIDPTTDYMQGVGAILEAWYPGALGGTAIADALFGDYNPSGRLPLTVYRSEEQLPPFVDYNMMTAPGRSYKYFQEQPLFPFGFGLSYTQWNYSNLALSSSVIKVCQALSLSVELQNVGQLSGQEVVQLYVQTPQSKFFPVPLLALQNFTKAGLLPGQKISLEFALPPQAMSVVDNAGVRNVQSGLYRLWVGGRQPTSTSISSTSTPSAGGGDDGITAVLTASFQVVGQTIPLAKCSSAFSTPNSRS